MRVNADAEHLPCLPVEEGDEAIDLKLLPSPSPPSRQEMLEHNLTHWPFRSWCKHCVAGKAKATKHSQSGATAASEVPVISIDCAFMGDKDVEDTESEGIVTEADFEFNDAVESKSKILVIRDSKSRVCAAIPVPRTGADNEEWNLKESLRCFLNYWDTLALSSNLIRSEGYHHRSGRYVHTVETKLRLCRRTARWATVDQMGWWSEPFRRFKARSEP